MLCTKYKNMQAGYSSTYPDDDKCVWSSADNQPVIFVKDTSFNGDVNAFTNAMKGQLLAYEKTST